MKTYEAHYDEQEDDLPDPPQDDELIAARRCYADWQGLCEQPAWGSPQLLLVTDQFGLGFSKAMFGWLFAQAQAADAISLRFTFLELAVLWAFGHSNDLPKPHPLKKNTWIATASCMPMTLAAVVRLMRHFYAALSDLVPPKEEGINLLFAGVHTPQVGFPVVLSLSSVKLASNLLKAFTSQRPIRTVNDLARPFVVPSSFRRN